MVAPEIVPVIPSFAGAREMHHADASPRTLQPSDVRTWRRVNDVNHSMQDISHAVGLQDHNDLHLGEVDDHPPARPSSPVLRSTHASSALSTTAILSPTQYASTLSIELPECAARLMRIASARGIELPQSIIQETMAHVIHAALELALEGCNGNYPGGLKAQVVVDLSLPPDNQETQEQAHPFPHTQTMPNAVVVVGNGAQERGVHPTLSDDVDGTGVGVSVSCHHDSPRLEAQLLRSGLDAVVIESYGHHHTDSVPLAALVREEDEDTRTSPNSADVEVPPPPPVRDAEEEDDLVAMLDASVFEPRVAEYWFSSLVVSDDVYTDAESRVEKHQPSLDAPVAELHPDSASEDKSPIKLDKKPAPSGQSSDAVDADDEHGYSDVDYCAQWSVAPPSTPASDCASASCFAGSSQADMEAKILGRTDWPGSAAKYTAMSKEMTKAALRQHRVELMRRETNMRFWTGLMTGTVGAVCGFAWGYGTASTRALPAVSLRSSVMVNRAFSS